MRFYCSGVRRFLHPGFAVLLEMRLLVFSPRDHTPARRLDRRPWRWSMPKVLIIGNQSFKSAFAHVAFKGLKPGEQFIVQDKTSWARTPRCVRWELGALAQQASLARFRQELERLHVSALAALLMRSNHGSG